MSGKVQHHYKIKISDLRINGLFSQFGEGNISCELPEGERLNGFFVRTKDEVRINFLYNDWYCKINLISTPVNFGGERWWFLCPLSGKKCTVLYLYDRGLAGRKALNLSYYQRKLRGDCLYLSTIDRTSRIFEDIKYPYRNGKPTRKFKKAIRLYESIGYDEERVQEEFMLQGCL